VPDHLHLLETARTILLIDYPGRIVPETLARAGYEVVTHEGPGPMDYGSYAVAGSEVVPGPRGPAPEHADLVCSHRPVAELPGIVEEAVRIGATAVWVTAEAAGDEARSIVEAAGLAYVGDPPILDALEELQGRPGR
jgi:predicted CoA-binding protein